MNHLEMGFVVPVWVFWYADWRAAWADVTAERAFHLDGNAYTFIRIAHVPDLFRPRDPNAGGADRPDLMEGQT